MTANAPRPSSIPFAYCIALGFIFALGYAILVGLICHHGAEVAGWDSLCYLAFAQSGNASDLPLHHGIGYAGLLRAFILVFGGVQGATAACNVFVAFLFAWLLSAGFVRRFGRLGALGTGCVLLNYAVLENFGRTMSEPLFILMLTASFFLFGRFTKGGRIRWLVLSALAMSCACLTRYAGIAFVASMALLLWQNFQWSRRGFARAVLHAGIAMLPLVAVMAWNHAARGSATNRVFLFHSPRLSELSDAGETLASWLVPDRLWLAFPGLPWLFLGLAVLGLFAVCLRALATRDFQAACWWLPVAVYLVFLLLAFSFFDSNISFDRRILSPIVFFVAGAICLHASRAGWRRRLAFTLLLGYLCLFGAWRTRGFAVSRFAHGSGYYGEAWNQSPLVARIEREHGHRIVYSNAEMGFGVRGVEGIRGIVCTKSATSWQVIPQWEDAYQTMLADLANGAILANVLLESAFWREEYVPLEQIVRDAGLEKLAEYPDGTIWGIPDLKDDFLDSP